jgi:1,4-dihydroxy-2-naphthoyl-CoA hydrolase
MSVASFERSVRFQDIDAAGIVFYARVFDYFHDAMFLHYEARGLSMAGVMRDADWLLPIVHADADYQAPMRFGDSVTVSLERAEVGRSSLTIHFAVRSTRSPELVHAVGKIVSVCIDRTSFKPRALPEEVVRSFDA